MTRKSVWCLVKPNNMLIKSAFSCFLFLFFGKRKVKSWEVMRPTVTHNLFLCVGLCWWGSRISLLNWIISTGQRTGLNYKHPVFFFFTPDLPMISCINSKHTKHNNVAIKCIVIYVTYLIISIVPGRGCRRKTKFEVYRCSERGPEGSWCKGLG